jgi:uncharacterized protein (TIGR02266 family)
LEKDGADMFQYATEETYQDGQIIFGEGSSGDWIYVIQSGEVEISKKIRGEKVVIEVLKEGEIFGELGFISKQVRSATARAMGPTNIGIIDREFLDMEFNKLSSGFLQILMSLTTRLKKASQNANLGRKEPRIPKGLSLTFKTRESLINAYTENISSGGLYIKTPKPLQKGETLSIKLQIPDEPEPIKVEAVVAWSRTEGGPDGEPPGMGIQFIQVSDSDRQKLLGCIKQ